MDVAGAMQGFETFAFNNAVRRYERTGDIDVLKGHTGTTDAGVALRSNYSFGDEAAVDQAWRIADGTDLLRIDVEPARSICQHDRGKPVRVGHGATSKDRPAEFPPTIRLRPLHPKTPHLLGDNLDVVRVVVRKLCDTRERILDVPASLSELDHSLAYLLAHRQKLRHSSPDRR